ncbi:expressed unknown protein [Seminavis robusta]|uniref:Uncharacterized protein n=1 Tax=Seminavis robusta TaxID=568900 RepID=A0A9N8H3R7_9STRA|nr:expressed unknown protein [Seminavis robusta]|eukprot:Sro67_g037680.1 n/a (285) ;mRNA; f:99131-99985
MSRRFDPMQPHGCLDTNTANRTCSVIDEAYDDYDYESGGCNVSTLVESLADLLLRNKRRNGILVTTVAMRLCKVMNTKRACLEVVAAGGHTLLIAGLKELVDNENIARILSSCLSCFTLNFRKFCRGQLGVFYEMHQQGGTHAVVHAMARHPTKQDLQVTGITFITNMVLCGHHLGGPIKRAYVAHDVVNNLQGVKVVVNAMKSFPRYKLLQRNACVLLATLCRLGSFRHNTEVMKTEAFVGVSLAAENFPTDPKVREAADLFMREVVAVDFLRGLWCPVIYQP